jgi:hypothetical protein
MTSLSWALRLQTRPIGQPLRGSPVLSGEGVRSIVRSYFVSSGFTSELVLDMPYPNSEPTSKPGRPRELGSLGLIEPLQEVGG